MKTFINRLIACFTVVMGCLFATAQVNNPFYNQFYSNADGEVLFMIEGNNPAVSGLDLMEFNVCKMDGSNPYVRFYGTPSVVNTIIGLSGDFVMPSAVEFMNKTCRITEWNPTYNADNLKSIILPFGVEQMGMLIAGGRTPKLESVSLPSSLKEIVATSSNENGNILTNGPAINRITMEGFFPPSVICGNVIQIGYENQPLSPLIPDLNPQAELKVPKGSGWFYSIHPSFASFEKIEEIEIEGEKVEYVDATSGAKMTFIRTAYGEAVLVGVAETDAVSIDIPVVVASESEWLKVVGIGPGVFKNMAKLAQVNIPACIRFVCGGAFDGCGLRKLTLPYTLNYAGRKAFANLKDLEKVYIWAFGDGVISPKAVFSSDAFEGSYKIARLEVGYGSSLDTSVMPWSGFSNISSVEEISDKISSIKVDTGKGYLRISSPGSLRVFDVDGKLLQSLTNPESKVLELASGVYILSNEEDTLRVMVP